VRKGILDFPTMALGEAFLKTVKMFYPPMGDLVGVQLFLLRFYPPKGDG